MEYQLTALHPRHQSQVMKIFNAYTQASFSAWFTDALPDQAFDLMLRSCQGYPAFAAQTPAGDIVGFGMLKPYHPGDAVRRTAELSYFIAPEHTRNGLGRRILGRLEQEAAAKGIDNLVASVSSLNEPSIRFHHKNGFKEAGRLLSAGRKLNCDFDIILFQKRR